MASFGVEKYSATIKRLFPIGWAFRFYEGLNITKIIDSLSIEPDRVEKRAYKILDELDPNTTYRDWETDRKSTRLNSSHITRSRMPSSA